MSIPRRLEAEWLDQLPADDPRAVRTRRDLSRINAWMLNAGVMARALIRHGAGEQPRTIVDLGCGDGRFMLRVARRVAPHWRNVTVVLVDQQDIVSRATREAFGAIGWRPEPHAGDVFEFLKARSSPVDVITANLFLHHFDGDGLGRLLAAAARLAPLVVACEPRRAKFVVRASRLLWIIGCNDVSIHDAVVSARAGFAGKELSARWPRQDPWELDERPAGLFTHRFIARRGAQAR